MQNSFFSLFRPFVIALVAAAMIAYSSNATASLSTRPATPNQIVKSALHVQTKNSNTAKVLSVYRSWAGTRYRLGGTTKAGIDCSAFVKVAMGSAFNLHLPRSTSEQKSSGKAISKKELRSGDLVFFRKNHHVGIYIGNGKFVHASTSRGVTTSSLSERYWARHYSQSRRVL